MRYTYLKLTATQLCLTAGTLYRAPHDLSPVCPAPHLPPCPLYSLSVSHTGATCSVLRCIVASIRVLIWHQIPFFCTLSSLPYSKLPKQMQFLPHFIAATDLRELQRSAKGFSLQKGLTKWGESELHSRAMSSNFISLFTSLGIRKTLFSFCR